MPEILDAYGRPMQMPEVRATTKDPSSWLIDAFGGGSKTTSGERVNAKIAMTVMAFFACVRNISEDVTKLPKVVRQQLEPRGSKDLRRHPVSMLMRFPSQTVDRHAFWQAFIAHALTYESAYAEIEYKSGQPYQLHLLDPNTVTVRELHDGGEWLYHVRGMSENKVIRPGNMLTLHGLGFDSVTGYRVSDLARQLLGAAVALQKYRGAFFGNGATPTGVLQHPMALGDEAQERLRRQFDKRYTGAENANGIMTLEEGMTWTQVSVDPERAQMVDLTNVTAEDIFRIFRMPPHKAGHLQNATFSNIEHQAIEYDTDTLDPWVDKFRSQVNFKLFTDEEKRQDIGLYVNMNALIRGDIQTRTQHYKDMYYMGAMSANDILELEDRNPVKDGDRYFVQGNLVPADSVDDVIVGEPEQTQAPMPPGAEPSETADEEPDAGNRGNLRAAMCLILESKIGDILRMETDKAKRAKATNIFYSKHRAHVEKQISDQVEAVQIGMGIENNTDTIASDFARDWCIESKQDVESGTLDSWQDGSRAFTQAEKLMELIECSSIEA